MKIRGLGRARHFIGRVRRRFSAPPLVLLYHRVADVSTDPQLLSVSPKHFREHLEVLRNSSRIYPFRELIALSRENNVPAGAVAITFDDGYLDNLENAKPALEAAGIPATIYIPTDFVGERRQFWWDRLERLLLHPSALPEHLEISVNCRARRWHLGEYTSYSEAHFARYRNWNVLDRETPTPRHEAYRELCELLRPLSRKAQEQLLGVIAAACDDACAHRVAPMLAGEVGSFARPSEYPEKLPASVEEHLTDAQSNDSDADPRCVSHAALSALAGGGLLEFGAHTRTHCALGALQADQQEAEIIESREALEEMIGRKVTSFSYPYGDYSAESVRIVRDAGFSDAVTTQQHFVSSSPSYFEIPRVVIRDWDGETFEHKLREWQIG